MSIFGYYGMNGWFYVLVVFISVVVVYFLVDVFSVNLLLIFCMFFIEIGCMMGSLKCFL